MKISTKGRYALRMMLDLAIHQNEGFVSLKDIADRQGISKKYLEQIVPLLNRTGMLRTNRGYQGGYRLAKSPDAYTVGEILRLTEGDLAPLPVYREIPSTVNVPTIVSRCLSGKDYIMSSTTISTISPCRMF